MALIFSASASANLKKVRAEGTYVIEHVDQNLQIMYNGYVLVNNTVQLSGQKPDSFLLGFPHAFGSYFVDCLAFDASNTSSTFPVSVNEPLAGKSGYYAIRVDFSGGAPQIFSIDVLFSNRLIIQDGQNASLYALVFPEFPSLTQNANTFNCSISLPKNATYVKGTVANVTYSQQNLPAFAYNLSTLTFYVGNYEMQLFDTDQLNREIAVSEFGDISASDTYYITNRGSFSLSSLSVQLPQGASGVTADDQLGRTMSVPQEVGNDTNRYTLNLSMPIDPTYSTKFIVSYDLPSGTYVKKQSGSNNFAVDMTVFRDLDYYVNDTSVTFVLPEGARIQALSDHIEGSLDIDKGVFQETVVISKEGVMALNGYSFEIDYEYNYIWVAFRPTTWIMALSIAGVLAVVILRRPKAHVQLAVSKATTLVRSEDLRSFVDKYEERMKILTEMDVLEVKARKGRIPRQRYKVQRKTLETRLDSSSRTLEELMGKIHSAGGHYSNLMDQLEVAEAQLREVETNVEAIESRHHRGELSLEAYRKLENDYQKRKERAQTAINGILLRLREEIR